MTLAELYPQPKRVTQIIVSIRQLEADEQLVLIQELAHLLRRQTYRSRARRKVTEFRGVGKQGWQGINIDDYIQRERESWG